MEIEKENKILHQILQFNAQINMNKSHTELLPMLLDTVIQLTESERGFILLGEEKKIYIARNFDQEWLQDAHSKISHSIIQQVYETKKYLITTHAQSDPLLPISSSIKNLKLRTILCFPLQTSSIFHGILYLDNRFTSDSPDETMILYLQYITTQISIVLHHNSIVQSLEKQIHTLQFLLQQTHDPNQDPHHIIQTTVQKQNIYQYGEAISIHESMNELFQRAFRASQSEAPILILGESGSGKGILAHAIHATSSRKNEIFIAENCAAIPESLLESELFGYKKGAFTGATENRPGLFQQARGGTLFLDEVGDMSLSMQVKLLRVLETNTVRPVGSQQWEKIDIRLITATHKNLAQMVKERTFREDLWYRLKVLTLDIPPLRKRHQDIMFLTKHFLQKNKIAQEKHIQEPTPETWKTMMQYAWPGNIRQLQHEIEKIVIYKIPNTPIQIEDLSPEILNQSLIPIPSQLPLKNAIAQFTKNYILQTIQEVQGNKTKAAKVLGLTRRTLYNKLKDPNENTQTKSIDS
ncbi:MAG TPA: sigma-54-dependent Fis family transcriptional regulator [Planctomycetota bacterium]|nr:sigma-54-dependent Fis family transcriptional regulator [Planctomycetota bacterium]HQB00634.1 sigma-54-dependent Fis family transcriptional regulator [Planctomycetota bacterium]